MKTIKQTAEYTVQQRRDGRYAVRGKDKKWINGDAKVEILVKEGLLKQDMPKSKAEPDTEERAVEGSVSEEEETEASGEEADEAS